MDKLKCIIPSKDTWQAIGFTILAFSCIFLLCGMMYLLTVILGYVTMYFPNIFKYILIHSASDYNELSYLQQLVEVGGTLLMLLIFIIIAVVLVSFIYQSFKHKLSIRSNNVLQNTKKEK